MSKHPLLFTGRNVYLSGISTSALFLFTSLTHSTSHIQVYLLREPPSSLTLVDTSIQSANFPSKQYPPCSSHDHSSDRLHSRPRNPSVRPKSEVARRPSKRQYQALEVKCREHRTRILLFEEHRRTLVKIRLLGMYIGSGRQPYPGEVISHVQ
jgi:hypothetical protein